MSTPLVRLLFAAVPGLVPLAAVAANPTLDDLLARAKQEEAAGHQFAPAGDNVVETISQMMALVPTATPEQLVEMVGLLDRTKKATAPTALAKVDPAALPPEVDKTPPPAPSAQAEQVSPPPAVAAATVAPPRTAPGDADEKQHVSELLARGHAAETRGDVSGARRFYMSAAELNSPEAARSLGRLYDPAYLGRTAIGGLDPDPALARKWYGRAVALGDVEAGPLLAAMSSR